MPILFIKHVNRSFLLTQNLRLNKLKTKVNIIVKCKYLKTKFHSYRSETMSFAVAVKSLVSNIGGKQEKVSLLVNSEEVFVFTKVIETKT